jgi:hypothetical protein
MVKAVAVCAVSQRCNDKAKLEPQPKTSLEFETGGVRKFEGGTGNFEPARCALLMASLPDVARELSVRRCDVSMAASY